MAAADSIVKTTWDVEKIRRDFPILNQKVNGKALVYFDNAATTQKPLSVINALTEYYSSYNANIHRGIHSLAEKATGEYEKTRDAAQRFLNAKHIEEILFTRGTTEGINLVASTWGRQNIKAGDEIIVSAMEHHSNMVPWHMLCTEKGAKLRIIPINDAGEIIFEEYLKLLSEKTKLVSVVHVSNSLGTINPVEQIIQEARKVGAKVLLDGAQSSSHLDLDVQKLDTDFFVCSAHKLYGPTGIGILYGKKEILEAMPPYQGGGEMISEVTYDYFTTNELPYKFEAGTPNIADTVAFRYALEYINNLGKENIRAYEHELLEYATQQLSTLDGIKLIGTAKEKVSINSFVFSDIHHQDIAILLDREGVAVRTGHHCTQPLMGRLGITGTSRASFAFYNTREEIDIMMTALRKVIKMMR